MEAKLIDFMGDDAYEEPKPTDLDLPVEDSIDLKVEENE